MIPKEGNERLKLTLDGGARGVIRSQSSLFTRNRVARSEGGDRKLQVRSLVGEHPERS